MLDAVSIDRLSCELDCDDEDDDESELVDVERFPAGGGDCRRSSAILMATCWSLDIWAQSGHTSATVSTEFQPVDCIRHRLVCLRNDFDENIQSSNFAVAVWKWQTYKENLEIIVTPVAGCRLHFILVKCSDH